MRVAQVEIETLNRSEHRQTPGSQPQSGNVTLASLYSEDDPVHVPPYTEAAHDAKSSSDPVVPSTHKPQLLEFDPNMVGASMEKS